MNTLLMNNYFSLFYSDSHGDLSSCPVGRMIKELVPDSPVASLTNESKS